ncbi:antirestriction protein ArdA [Actinokineospora sp. PR83]|uniref:antirestriction protein ArdA n=1 Tax=Actinokineospora sp. PR83 TaxID=2884908 RepID=UPI001F47EF20|nr:antirestriction protein ArdA [Actinokineospora sp. PR83]MCG8914897.1 antirestriction protein ArdA [Actinokineospora sp. PR83]
MEQQHPYQGGENPYFGVNSYGTDDPVRQAEIEQARMAASRERREARARLERYVAVGVDPDDAETLIEFQDMASDREPEQSAESVSEPVTDEQRIHHGITDALRDNRPIDHATARAIAAQLHGGQESPLYALVSSGALVEGLAEELDTWRRDDTLVELEPWLDALDEYITGRAAAPEPVDGWATLWPGDPPVSTERAADAQEVPGQVHAALGSTALAASGEEVTEHRPADRLTAAVAAAETLDQPIDPRTVQVLARHFKGEAPDSPLAVLAGCGTVFNEDDELYRELYRDWEQHSSDEQRWVKALHRYVVEYAEQTSPVPYWPEGADSYDTPSGVKPEIWVASLLDYNNGLNHGMWIRADQEPEALHEQISWILRTSPTARRYGEAAEEWGIFDQSDFPGHDVYEYASMETVTLLARGLAKHGEPYGHWVALVGEDSTELIDPDKFHEHYEGTWDSLEDYAEEWLTETGAYEFLEQVPEDFRQYVKVDVEAYVRDLEASGLSYVELGGGRVAVYR